MSGIRTLLNIAKSALMTNQTNVSVASHNLANVNTKGYSKQESMMYAKPGVRTINGIIGDGVDISEIRRREAKFAERRLFEENTQYRHWETRRQIMDQMEVLFSGVGESDLNTWITKFFNAWEDLSGNPSDMVFRAELTKQAKSLTDNFHSLSSEIDQIRGNITDEIISDVHQVNELLYKIDELNMEIANIQYNGVKANDLQDRRAQHLRALSDFLDIDIHERQNGKIAVFHQGHLLVSDNMVFEISAEKVKQNNVVTTNLQINNTDIEINSGKIGGLFQVQENMLDSYKESIDAIAASIVEQVNSTHTLGFDLNGDLGINFFDPGKQTAGSIALNDEITQDLKKIAAASGTHDWPAGIHVSNGIGDNSNALRIAELRYLRVMQNNSTTFEEVYNKLYAEVGFDASDAIQNEDSHLLLVEQLQNYRDSTVGVSSDEELADIEKFQNAYAASARLINIADEMFQSLINMLG